MEPGGIYYIKTNKFHEIHFVDLRVIFDCNLVSPRLITPDEDKFLTTELDCGLFRKEAVELLGYDYKETKAGKLSISGDLSLVREIRLAMVSVSRLTLTEARNRRPLHALIPGT